MYGAHLVFKYNSWISFQNTEILGIPWLEVMYHTSKLQIYKLVELLCKNVCKLK